MTKPTIQSGFQKQSENASERYRASQEANSHGGKKPPTHDQDRLERVPLGDGLTIARIQGETRAVDMADFHRAIQAAASVACVRVYDKRGRELGTGNGIRVSPRLLLTNHHVLKDAGEAEFAQAWFSFEKDVDGVPTAPKIVSLDPTEFFYTDPHLDFTLVAIDSFAHDGTDMVEHGYAFLLDDESLLGTHEALSVVEHPGGGYKQVFVRGGQALGESLGFLHYSVDSEVVSSGAAVFNDEWELVGIQHAAIHSGHDASHQSAIANEAVQTLAICHALKEREWEEPERGFVDELFEHEAIDAFDFDEDEPYVVESDFEEEAEDHTEQDKAHEVPAPAVVPPPVIVSEVAGEVNAPVVPTPDGHSHHHEPHLGAPAFAAVGGAAALAVGGLAAEEIHHETSTPEHAVEGTDQHEGQHQEPLHDDAPHAESGADHVDEPAVAGHEEQASPSAELGHEEEHLADHHEEPAPEAHHEEPETEHLDQASPTVEPSHEEEHLTEHHEEPALEAHHEEPEAEHLEQTSPLVEHGHELEHVAEHHDSHLKEGLAVGAATIGVGALLGEHIHHEVSHSPEISEASQTAVHHGETELLSPPPIPGHEGQDPAQVAAAAAEMEGGHVAGLHESPSEEVPLPTLEGGKVWAEAGKPVGELDKSSYTEHGFDHNFLETVVSLPRMLPNLKQQVAKTTGGVEVLDYAHFSVVLNGRRKMPFFTAINVDRSLRKGDAHAPYLPLYDSRLDHAQQLGPEVFADGHLTEGYLIRTEDAAWGASAARGSMDSHHFTTSVATWPHHVDSFWNTLEETILDLARPHSTKGSFFAGPIFQPEDPDYKGLRIPVSFWKVAVISTGYGGVTAMAFKHAQGPTMAALGQHSDPLVQQVKLSEIERLTGLDFGDLRLRDPLERRSDLEQLVVRSWSDIIKS